MRRMSTTSQSMAFCELSEDDTRIVVFFAYNRAQKDAIKAIAGARFHNEGPDGPHWSVPARIENARKLREIFGPGLELGEAVKRWGHIAVGTQNRRTALTTADTYPVERLKISKTHSELARYLRPYQRADVALMSEANILNANQPGTGKTVEVLAALCEAGLEHGCHLVIAPVASLENVWRPEIERWMPGATVYTSEDATERQAQMLAGIAAAKRGEEVWVLTNVEYIRPRRLTGTKAENVDPAAKLPINDYKTPRGVYVARDEIHEAILSVNWSSYTMDEFHKWGLNSRNTVTTWGSSIIKARRRYLLSGTPLGGKPENLFAPLRDIEPKRFSSFWRWAGEWLQITETVNPYARGGNDIIREIGGLKDGSEEKFFEGHAQHMVRRTKREALPGLPEKNRVVVMCEMTKRQRHQYEQFEADAEVQMEGGTINATNALSEYARLKQFANAFCKLDKNGRVIPTTDSSKLPQLLERLDEFGIRKASKQNSQTPEPGARAIVASQSSRMAEMVSAWLTKQGITNGLLTGDTKDRKSIIDTFTHGTDEPYVIVMTTQTGGTSLNLERANSVHILDESWNPDNEEQLEDRGDRGSRTTPLTCVYYRTRGTVQETIAAVAKGKAITNKNILDIVRQAKKMKASKS